MSDDVSHVFRPFVPARLAHAHIVLDHRRRITTNTNTSEREGEQRNKEEEGKNTNERSGQPREFHLLFLSILVLLSLMRALFLLIAWFQMCSLCSIRNRVVHVEVEVHVVARGEERAEIGRGAGRSGRRRGSGGRRLGRRIVGRLK